MSLQYDVCAVVISAAAHVHLLSRVALSATVQQSQPPAQLVVALSGVTPEQCSAASASVSSALQAASASVLGVDLIMLCSDKMQSSGQNRNRGAAAC